MSSIDRIDTLIDQFKQYLKQRLSLTKELNALIDKYHKYKSSTDYVCMYCKEIYSIFKLTGEFNCSFKPMNILQLNEYKYNIHKQDNKIILVAILSMESTEIMGIHYQYLFDISINITNREFTINDKYNQIVINCYDPVLSKSIKYKSMYKYDESLLNENENDKIGNDKLFKTIESDNLKSLPTEMADYYNENYVHQSLENKKEEIRRIFPFLQDIAISKFAQSTDLSKYFLYAKVIISPYFDQLVGNAFVEHDYNN